MADKKKDEFVKVAGTWLNKTVIGAMKKEDAEKVIKKAGIDLRAGLKAVGH